MSRSGEFWRAGNCEVREQRKPFVTGWAGSPAEPHEAAVLDGGDQAAGVGAVAVADGAEGLGRHAAHPTGSARRGKRRRIGARAVVAGTSGCRRRR